MAKKPETQWSTCSGCGGTGRVTVVQGDEKNLHTTERHCTTDNCSGTGKTWKIVWVDDN